jgi:hypothetical protein
MARIREERCGFRRQFSPADEDRLRPYFYRQIRAGHTDPEMLVDRVAATVRRASSRAASSDPDKAEQLRRCLALLAAHRAEAADFAALCIEEEPLDRAWREEERWERTRRYWEPQLAYRSPSAKQIGILLSLGVARQDIPLDGQSASQLIRLLEESDVDG